jgi:hypothetical protein
MDRRARVSARRAPIPEAPDWKGERAEKGAMRVPTTSDEDELVVPVYSSIKPVSPDKRKISEEPFRGRC